MVLIALPTAAICIFLKTVLSTKLGFAISKDNGNRITDYVETAEGSSLFETFSCVEIPSINVTDNDATENHRLRCLNVVSRNVDSGPNPEARPKSGESIFIKRGGAHASSTRSSWRHLPTGSVH